MKVQTSPIYVSVNGKPVRADARSACYLAEYVEKAKGFLGNLSAGEYAAVMPEYVAAKGDLCGRVSEANADQGTAFSCSACGI